VAFCHILNDKENTLKSECHQSAPCILLANNAPHIITDLDCNHREENGPPRVLSLAGNLPLPPCQYFIGTQTVDTGIRHIHAVEFEAVNVAARQSLERFSGLSSTHCANAKRLARQNAEKPLADLDSF